MRVQPAWIATSGCNFVRTLTLDPRPSGRAGDGIRSSAVTNISCLLPGLQSTPSGLTRKIDRCAVSCRNSRFRFGPSARELSTAFRPRAYDKVLVFYLWIKRGQVLGRAFRVRFLASKSGPSLIHAVFEAPAVAVFETHQLLNDIAKTMTDMGPHGTICSQRVSRTYCFR